MWPESQRAEANGRHATSQPYSKQHSHSILFTPKEPRLREAHLPIRPKQTVVEVPTIRGPNTDPKS